MDDLEQRMKEKILEGLVEHMDNKMGDDLSAKFPKKAMEVSVAAPDKEHLSEGLEHAQAITGDSDEGSDEDRLMELLGEDKDDDDDLKGL